MGFLKRLFGGGSGGDKDGLYFYIKAHRTGEVIQLRLNQANDLSLMDDNQTYYVRKIVVGQRSFDRIEAEFFFNSKRQFTSAGVSGGDLVDEAAYDAYIAGQQEAE